MVEHLTFNQEVVGSIPTGLTKTPQSMSHWPCMNATLRRSILPLALTLLLAGCMTAAQQAQRDEGRCAARGYQPNTNEYTRCMTDLESERDARREANRREMLERSSTPYIPAASNR